MKITVTGSFKTRPSKLLHDYAAQPGIVIAKSILVLLVALDSFLVVSQDYPEGTGSR